MGYLFDSTYEGADEGDTDSPANCWARMWLVPGTECKLTFDFLEQSHYVSHIRVYPQGVLSGIPSYSSKYSITINTGHVVAKDVDGSQVAYSRYLEHAINQYVHSLVFDLTGFGSRLGLCEIQIFVYV